jgi:hypothetical protein
MRISAQEEEKEIMALLVKIVPIVIFTHIGICCLRFTKALPNFHNYFPVGSTFGNPDKLGAYLSVLLPFCYIKQKIIGYSLFVLCTLLLFLSQARTALFAAVLTGISYLFLTKKLSKKIFSMGINPFNIWIDSLNLLASGVCFRSIVYMDSSCINANIQAAGVGIICISKALS